MFEYEFIRGYHPVKVSSGAAEERVQFKILLPAKTRLLPTGTGNDIGFLKSGDLILDKGIDGEQDPFEITTIKGKDLFRIRLKYEAVPQGGTSVSRESIQEQAKEINQKLDSVSPEKVSDLIQYDFLDLSTSVKMNTIKEVVDETLRWDDTYGSVLLFSVMRDMAKGTEPKWKMLFVDYSLSYADGVVPEQEKTAPNMNKINQLNATINESNHVIGINIKKKLEGFEEKEKIRYLFVSQLAYARDLLKGQEEYGPGIKFSSRSKELQSYYNEEINNIPEEIFRPARSGNIGDFMATILAFMYSNQIYMGEEALGDLEPIKGVRLMEAVRMQVPKTVKWIQDELLQVHL